MKLNAIKWVFMCCLWSLVKAEVTQSTITQTNFTKHVGMRPSSDPHSVKDCTFIIIVYSLTSVVLQTYVVTNKAEPLHHINGGGPGGFFAIMSYEYVCAIIYIVVDTVYI